MSLASIEFLTAKTALVAGREQTIDVLVRIKPKAEQTGANKRPNLNLSLVIDRSGSMQGDKMIRAREAAQYCVEQMLPIDRLSVVIFDDIVEVLIASQKIEDKYLLKSRIESIAARNSTALHEGWVQGGLQVSEHLDARAVNRVLLITDGLANVGETNTDRIVTAAKHLFERGVSTSTIGIGADFNEDLLMPMAEAAGGNAWHVERAEDMQKIFAVELEGLIAQIAHTVTLGLVPADGVRITDVLNDFETSETGRYKLPNLQAGSALDIVIQLKVPAQASDAKLRLLDLKLGFTPQDSTQADVAKEFLEIGFADEMTVEKLPENYEVKKAVQLLMNARARREAITLMDKGNYAEAQRGLRAMQASTQVLAAAMPAAAAAGMDAESAQLRELESALYSRADDKSSRKKMAYQSYSRRSGKS
jgi:Ca-activated chloride channel family protein